MLTFSASFSPNFAEILKQPPRVVLDYFRELQYALDEPSSSRLSLHTGDNSSRLIFGDVPPHAYFRHHPCRNKSDTLMVTFHADKVLSLLYLYFELRLTIKNSSFEYEENVFYTINFCNAMDRSLHIFCKL